MKIHSSEVEEKLALSSLHLGGGYAHLEGTLSIVGIEYEKKEKREKSRTAS